VISPAEVHRPRSWKLCQSPARFPDRHGTSLSSEPGGDSATRLAARRDHLRLLPSNKPSSPRTPRLTRRWTTRPDGEQQGRALVKGRHPLLAGPAGKTRSSQSLHAGQRRESTGPGHDRESFKGADPAGTAVSRCRSQAAVRRAHHRPGKITSARWRKGRAWPSSVTGGDQSRAKRKLLGNGRRKAQESGMKTIRPRWTLPQEASRGRPCPQETGGQEDPLEQSLGPNVAWAACAPAPAPPSVRDERSQRCTRAGRAGAAPAGKEPLLEREGGRGGCARVAMAVTRRGQG